MKMRAAAGQPGRSGLGLDHSRVLVSRGAPSGSSLTVVKSEAEAQAADAGSSSGNVAAARRWASESSSVSSTKPASVTSHTDTQGAPSPGSSAALLTSKSISTGSFPTTTTIASTNGGSDLTSGTASESLPDSTALSSTGSSSPSISTSLSNTDPNTSTNTNTGNTNLFQTTITTSIPTTLTTLHDSTLTTETTLIPTTITTTTNFAASGTVLPDLGTGNVASQQAGQVQSVCIGHGLDVPAAGTLATLVIPSVVGLLIWVSSIRFLSPELR